MVIHMKQADRACGTLLGLVAGDRNGGPCRFALRLAESLVERGRFDPTDVLHRYVAWWEDGAFDTGPTAAGVLRRVSEGEATETAVAAVHRAAGGRTAGVGPAHRAAPLAVFPYVPQDELLAAARAEARLTHGHALAGWVSGAVCLLVRALVNGRPWAEACEGVADALPAQGGEDRSSAREPERDPSPVKGAPAGGAALVADIVRSAARAGGEEAELSAGGYAPETLRAALHFTANAPATEEALERSLRFAGPANYAPVLVGALAGARWGAEAVPRALLEHEAPLADRFRRLVIQAWE